MVKIGLEERKAIQLEILSAVDKFCKENSINYSLGYGTLLGAVRHKGFIPWDDDIDLVMLREDYEKFERDFPNEYLGKYVFLSTNKYPNWHLPFGKLADNRTLIQERKAQTIPHGINIDIFPLDDVPEDEETFLRFKKKMQFLMACHRIKIFKITKESSLRNRMLGRLLKFVLLPVSQSSLLRNIIKLSKSYNGKEHSRVYYNPSIDKSKSLKKALFSNYSSVVFEEQEFLSIQDTHSYLVAMYGKNYMTPPPEEKRGTLHTSDAYWINKRI